MHLSKPASDESVHGCVVFEWEVTYTLGSGEVYDLRVCQGEGCTPRSGISHDPPPVTWDPRDTRKNPDLQGSEGVYRWQVVVIDGATKQEKTPRSLTRQFTWTGEACEKHGGGEQGNPTGP